MPVGISLGRHCVSWGNKFLLGDVRPLGIKFQSEESRHWYKGWKKPAMQWQRLWLSHHIHCCVRYSQKEGQVEATAANRGTSLAVDSDNICEAIASQKCACVERSLCENHILNQQMPSMIAKFLNSRVRWRVVRWRGAKKQCQVATKATHLQHFFSCFRKKIILNKLSEIKDKLFFQCRYLSHLYSDNVIIK